VVPSQTVGRIPSGLDRMRVQLHHHDHGNFVHLFDTFFP
jgi:hypothetical protein